MSLVNSEEVHHLRTISEKRTKFSVSAVNFDNTARCMAIWQQWRHFGGEKTLSVIAQTISAEVQEDFVIVQYLMECKRLRQCLYEFEVKFACIIRKSDAYI